MARAVADIGTTDYAVTIAAGRHPLVADEHADLGGQDAGPTPYELLCAALGACTTITLRMYANRKGWPLSGVHADIRFARDGEVEAIIRTLRLTGELDAAQRARLADIAERTPVTLTLKRSMAITTTLRD